VLEVDRVLHESVDEVLEKMFFIRSLGDSVGASGGPEIIAHLTFEGRPSGSFTLRAGWAAARSITADFLGMEEVELSESQVSEVVCELANMICGCALSRLECDFQFRLGMPVLLTSAPQVGGVAVSRAVELYNGAIAVTMNIEEPACSPAEEYAY
jgi:CheY-specific phosphatase CheX